MEKRSAHYEKTRIYNYYVPTKRSYEILRKGHAAKPKSRPIAAKRDGGGVGLPGTGSPRKILAFERWMQQEIAAYQRLISSDGSRPKATARLVASFFTKPTVSLAQNPCRSNDKAQKHAFDDGSEDQTLDDLCSYRVLFSLQLCQLCAHSLGMSRDSLASTLHNVCIATTRYTVKANICFSSTGCARPNFNVRLPISDNSWYSIHA